jgi:hypothetical protein
LSSSKIKKIKKNKKIKRKVNQIDIVPTISFLFNMTIPNNNKGVFIKEIFENNKFYDMNELILNNYDQLNNIEKEKIKLNNFPLNSYKNLIKKSEEIILKSVKYNIRNLYIGIFLTLISTILFFIFIKNNMDFGVNLMFIDKFIIILLFLEKISIFSTSLIEEKHNIPFLFNNSILFIYFLFFFHNFNVFFFFNFLKR